jgi:hypothetical protein
MATVTYYLGFIVMPVIWWPVVVVGIYVYWRTHIFPLLLVVLGSLLLGILGLMSLLFRPDTTYDAAGNVKIYAMRLLPVEVDVIVSSIAVSLIVVGLVVLFLRMRHSRVDT